VRDKAVVDPAISRSRAIAAKVAVLSIKQKLREIEHAVERKCEERKAANGTSS
jgi:hypothetical protein